MSTEEPEWLALLLREYELHRSAIDKYDGQRFQTRNWAVVVTGAIFSIAFATSRAELAVTAAPAILLFCFLEGVQMTIQVAIIRRTNILETIVNEYLADPEDSIEYTFGVSQGYHFILTTRAVIQVLRSRARFHVTSFYGLLLLMSLVGAVFVYFARP